MRFIIAGLKNQTIHLWSVPKGSKPIMRGECEIVSYRVKDRVLLVRPTEINPQIRCIEVLPSGLFFDRVSLTWNVHEYF